MTSRKYIIILLIIITVLSITSIIRAESQLIFNFDDGYRGVYENAFPVMKQYSLQGVVFVTTGYVNTEGHITTRQLLELKKSGWEIGSHTVHHPNLFELTERGIENEISKSKSYLIKNELIDENYASFCSPMAKWNTGISRIVKQHYQLARGEKIYILTENKKVNADIKIILKTTGLSTIKKWINKARENNKLIVLVFHDISTINHIYSYSPDKFIQLIKYIDQIDMEVKIYQQLFKPAK